MTTHKRYFGAELGVSLVVEGLIGSVLHILSTKHTGTCHLLLNSGRCFTITGEGVNITQKQSTTERLAISETRTLFETSHWKLKLETLSFNRKIKYT
jgi:hypothetical protein